MTSMEKVACGLCPYAEFSGKKESGSYVLTAILSGFAAKSQFDPVATLDVVMNARQLSGSRI